MNPGDIIEVWQKTGMSGEFIYHSLIKEYLCAEKDKLQKEIYEAEDMEMRSHIRNIFIHKIEERKEFLNHLLSKVLYEIENEA